MEVLVNCSSSSEEITNNEVGVSFADNLCEEQTNWK